MAYDFSPPFWSPTGNRPNHNAHGLILTTPTSRRHASNSMPNINQSGPGDTSGSRKRTRLSMVESYCQEQQTVSGEPFAFETSSLHDMSQSAAFEPELHNDTLANGLHGQSIPLEESKCGQKRSRTSDERAGAKIGQFVFNIVTGVAGKMWEFCTTMPFAGFKAGQGPSYDMISSGDGSLRRSSSTIQLPGQFPADRFAVCDLPSRDTPASNGWTLIHNPPQTDGEQRPHAVFNVAPISPSPRSPHARQSISRTLPRRRPRMSTPKASSIFSMREEHANVSRRSSLPAAPRSGPASPCSNISPAGSPEIQKLAARRQRDERRNDASMRKLNQQLQSMIREGREALATKVEVVGDELGVEGLEEDDSFAED